jgi:hypothetical protein
MILFMVSAFLTITMGCELIATVDRNAIPPRNDSVTVADEFNSSGPGGMGGGGMGGGGMGASAGAGGTGGSIGAGGAGQFGGAGGSDGGM